MATLVLCMLPFIILAFSDRPMPISCYAAVQIFLYLLILRPTPHHHSYSKYPKLATSRFSRGSSALFEAAGELLQPTRPP